MLSFANAVMKQAGANELKSNADCWKKITQGGKTMQQLKQEAGVWARTRACICTSTHVVGIKHVCEFVCVFVFVFVCVCVQLWMQ